MIAVHCACIEPQPVYPPTYWECLTTQEHNVSHFEHRQWCHEAALQERDRNLSRARVSPLMSKIMSDRFLNTHFHIHPDFIFSDVKDTSLCFQTHAVSFSLAVWCVRSHAGDPETPFDFTLNIIVVIFSKWFKCSVPGPRWWWWSWHRTVPHAALCMWNCLCCQRAGLSHERSKQTNHSHSLLSDLLWKSVKV